MFTKALEEHKRNLIWDTPVAYCFTYPPFLLTYEHNCYKIILIVPYTVVQIKKSFSRVCLSRVVAETEQKNSTFLFLP
jgi:hypothetical protein